MVKRKGQRKAGKLNHRPHIAKLLDIPGKIDIPPYLREDEADIRGPPASPGDCLKAKANTRGKAFA
jgi:hypothetical protein